MAKSKKVKVTKSKSLTDSKESKHNVLIKLDSKDVLDGDDFLSRLLQVKPEEVKKKK